jgi:hypothetical protein
LILGIPFKPSLSLTGISMAGVEFSDAEDYEESPDSPSATSSDSWLGTTPTRDQEERGLRSFQT